MPLYGKNDRFRRNIYFAMKEKVAVYGKLFELGLVSERIELDKYSDYTRDELLSDERIEWNEYKVKMQLQFFENLI